MNIRSFTLYLIAIALILSGCNGNDKKIEIFNSTDENEEKVGAILMKNDHLTSSVAVFYKEDLIVGVSVKTFSRFKKATIEKELTKELEEVYSDLVINVSADHKILMETKKLVESKEMNKMGKKIEKVKKLMKEET
ncbi:hypothetical protein ACXYMX_01015 [Sporosarcina sp. CAU 1771]